MLKQSCGVRMVSAKRGPGGCFAVSQCGWRHSCSMLFQPTCLGTEIGRLGKHKNHDSMESREGAFLGHCRASGVPLHRRSEDSQVLRTLASDWLFAGQPKKDAGGAVPDVSLAMSGVRAKDRGAVGTTG